MIELRHVGKTFAQFRAVWDLSFRCETGDVFGFVGPNGAGKTTTMRMMATLLDPDYGDVLIDGVSVLDEPEEIRRIIGYMPDYIGVYEGVEIREYLEFFAAAYRIPPDRRKKLVHPFDRSVDPDHLDPLTSHLRALAADLPEADARTVAVFLQKVLAAVTGTHSAAP